MRAGVCPSVCPVRGAAGWCVGWVVLKQTEAEREKKMDLNPSKADLNEAPSLRWYVAETEVNQERTAEYHLREKGFEAYLPMRRAGPQAKRICAVPYFPRYLLVRLAVGAAGWTGVFSAVGVKAVLGNARPLALPDRLITEIRSREHDGFIPVKPKTRKPAFKAGDHVRVQSGPFQGYDALFDEPVDGRRVWILLSFLGRDSRAVVDVSSLRSAS